VFFHGSSLSRLIVIGVHIGCKKTGCDDYCASCYSRIFSIFPAVRENVLDGRGESC
jgi:hypothetical protein